MRKQLSVLAMIALALPFAQTFAQDKGGLFIEPMLTYEKSDAEVDYPSPLGSSEGEQHGFGAAARLGFHVYESIFVALDGRYSRLDFEDDDNDYVTTGNSYNYGATLGFQVPSDVGIRVWGTYVLGGQLDPDKDNGIDLKFKDGHGYRLGAGILLGTVSLNLEYQKITYDKTEVEEVGDLDPDIENDDFEMISDGYVVSVSFPIAL